MISLATTQQYHCSTKIAMDNTCKLMQTPSLRNFPLSNSVTSDSLGFLSFWLAASHTDFFPFLSSLYHLMFSLCTFFFYSIISYPSSPLVLLRYVSLKAQSFVLCSRPTYLAAYWIYSLIHSYIIWVPQMLSDTSTFYSDLILWIPQLQEWHLYHLLRLKLRNCSILLFLTLSSHLWSYWALKHSAFLGFSFFSLPLF